MKLSGREQFSTICIHAGQEPDPGTGAIITPIFQTSTFVFTRAADGKRFFEGITGRRPGGTDGLVYSRFNNPNQEILEDRLRIWENAEESLAFSSGMTAITTLFLTFVRPGDVIVHSGPLYAATETIINKILGQFGIKYVDFPAGATREEIEARRKAFIRKWRLKHRAVATNAIERLHGGKPPYSPVGAVAVDHFARWHGKSGWSKAWPSSRKTGPRRNVADLSDDELLEALGVSVGPEQTSSRTPREECIIAGFEDPEIR